MQSLIQAFLPVGKPALVNKPCYQHHQPQQTLRYQLVQTHYPAVQEHQAAAGRSLPDHVQQEFTDLLKSGRLENGFFRVCCLSCQHEKLLAFSCKRRGFYPNRGARRIAESACRSPLPVRCAANSRPRSAMALPMSFLSRLILWQEGRCRH